MHIKKKPELPNNPYLDKEENLSTQFLNISHYTLLDDIPEMLCEWWSATKKEVRTFIQDEGLSEFVDDKTFIDILLGKYYFSNYFLMLIREKLPYNISIEKLYRSNKKFIQSHRAASKLIVDDRLIIKALKGVYAQKKDDRDAYIKNWHLKHKLNGAEAVARYRMLHKEEIKESKKKYRETHKEEIRAYKKSRREKDNEQQRQRYHRDIEKSREQGRTYQKKFYQKHKTEILAQQAEYRLLHREEILERARQRMENEEYRLRVRERGRANYRKNSAEIQQRRKQKRLQNLEQAKALEREYGKTYREKNREKINARNRANYQNKLLENRKINAEKQKKYRNKKRFKEETGKIIMPLLNALLLSKKEY